MEIKFSIDEIENYKKLMKSIDSKMVLANLKHLEAKNARDESVRKLSNKYLKNLGFKVGDYIVCFDKAPYKKDRQGAFGGTIKSAKLDDNGRLVIVLNDDSTVTITNDVTFLAHFKQEIYEKYLSNIKG